MLETSLINEYELGFGTRIREPWVTNKWWHVPDGTDREKKTKKSEA